jgi:hypothetical protein
MTSAMTIGTDADGTDRSITWGHSTLKTIIGIDDSADAFVINTDAAFDGTLANNSFSIDASHNAIIAGGLTVVADITIGTDADGTDRSIVLGHSTLKTIVGIDDSADAFVINTDAAFDGTLANNSLTIDSNHNVGIAGDLTLYGADITIGSDADGTDRSIVWGHSTLKTIMGIDDSADVFIINTDASFDNTLSYNSFSIDASDDIIMGGGVTVGRGVSVGTQGFTVGSTVITDDSIVMTPSTNDTVTISAAANGVLNITTVDNDVAAANIVVTADGTLDLNSVALDIDASAAVTINGLSVTLASSGAGDITLDSSDNVFITPDGYASIVAAEYVSLNATAGPIYIGATTDAYAINIGTGAAARTITVGNVTGATALVLNSGTGGIALASTGAGDITIDSDDTFLLDADGVLELNSSAGAISIGNDAVAQKISIGGDTGTRTEVELNAIRVDINAGANGFQIDAGAVSSVTTSAGALTIDSAANTLILDGHTGITLDASNSGNIEINVTAADDILIGNDAVAQDVLLGNAAATQVDLTAILVDINGGSSGVTIDGAAASNFTTSSGAITIDATASTLTLDGHSGVTIQTGTVSADITLDSGDDIHLMPTGYVGINDTTPESLLHMKGANPILTIQDTETGANSADARIRLAESDGSAAVDNYWDIHNSGLNLLLTRSDGTGNVVIRGCYVDDFAVNIKPEASGRHYASGTADYQENYSMHGIHNLQSGSDFDGNFNTTSGEWST